MADASTSALRRDWRWDDFKPAKMHENPAIVRRSQVATAQSCVWPPCRSSTPISIRDGVNELAKFGEESSLPTHGSDQCISACRYLAVVLAALINGEKRDVVLSPDWEALRKIHKKQPLDPLIHEIASGSFRRKQPPEIIGSGWVVKSLEAALWAFASSNSFEEAVLKAVNLGNDSDTTGAICGQLAGACWGESGIPAALRSGLAGKDLLENALGRLLKPA